jgi:hypothetical protein
MNYKVNHILHSKLEVIVTVGHRSRTYRLGAFKGRRIDDVLLSFCSYDGATKHVYAF